MIELYGVSLAQLPDRRGLINALDGALYTAWRERHKCIRDELAARASLAGILLLQLCAPQGTLAYETSGRPYFADAALDFNISHTDQAAFLALDRRDACEIQDRAALASSVDGTDAFRHHARVGLDAENLGRLANTRICPMASRWFTEREYALFSASPTDETFLRIWTRKESLIKWTGEGLKGLQAADTVLAEDRFGVRFHEYRIGSTLLSLCTHETQVAPTEVQMLHASRLAEAGILYG